MAELESVLPFVIVLAAFYLLLIRPARNRQREQQRLQASLAPGQQVMTSSGLIATVTAIEDDEVLLEAAPGVVLRWAKPAVARVLRPGESADDAVDIRDEQVATDAPTATPRPE